ncbi:MAG: DUF2141 domain-containing protein [Deltaproteobacteria bacterium]|nr:DUF2141 domain-containing protein [Deltaproteobacteria bacterium]
MRLSPPFAAVWLLFGMGSPLAAQGPSDAGPAGGKLTLTVEITGFRSDAGYAAAAIYRTKESYLKKPEVTRTAKIVGGRAILVFEAIEPGTLVVNGFHDENENGTLDTNWLGMPKEGTGVSRDAKGRMGPPKFDDARLELSAGTESISFKLVYL